MDHHKFPGMASTCCLDLLGQSRAPSFPYFSDWKFDYQSDLKPKILEGFALPWSWLHNPLVGNRANGLLHPEELYVFVCAMVFLTQLFVQALYTRKTNG
ncbi:hypothetical protein DY000_02041974 [Brassica cretica]|uniref:Chlorophyll a-b binding protein, chloroplastic n=1 Tax=Brassica cretica TaxID=69181 RepID=A0ABQ7BP11_BRACR|nr:hypothetical protein DY000_02041974 [Brassica cretica]